MSEATENIDIDAPAPKKQKLEESSEPAETSESKSEFVQDKYENFVTPEELEKLKEFQVLDEVKSNDEDSNEEDSDGSSDDSLPEEEIEKMLEEDLPEGFKGAPKPKEKPYVTRQKIVLEEKGVNHFEVLPLDWMMVRHYSGMPVYVHRTSRVCTLSKPYFLGKGNTRRHDIPISAIPCLAYRRALEEEKKQKEIDKNIEEQIKNGTWTNNKPAENVDVSAKAPSLSKDEKKATKCDIRKDAVLKKCPFRFSSIVSETNVGPEMINDSNKQDFTDTSVADDKNNAKDHVKESKPHESESKINEVEMVEDLNTKMESAKNEASEVSIEMDENKTKNSEAGDHDYSKAEPKEDQTNDSILNIDSSPKTKSDQDSKIDEIMSLENVVETKPDQQDNRIKEIMSVEDLNPETKPKENKAVKSMDVDEVSEKMTSDVSPASGEKMTSDVLPEVSEKVTSEAGPSTSQVRPVVLPGGIVMPPPRVESVSTSWKTQHLTHEQVNEYCKRLFKFKVVNIMHFMRWADRRKYTKARKTLQYPTLPEGTKLITIPAQPANGQDNGGKSSKRDWVMNMNGRSYLSVFHEYVRRALLKQPVYEFVQLENAATPYQATVYIGGMQYGVGHGSSKRQAKSAAARASIHILIPEMRDELEPGPASAEPDFSFFDYVGIEDPRITEFCAATCEPSPHAILRTCLLRNFGATDRHIHTEMKKLEFQKIELTMKVGKHSATVVCKNKKTAKQRASQAILQALHPHVRSWGSLLRLYGSRSVKSCKEKKLEEQQITLLQDKARHNEPNYAVLDKLRHDMRRLHDRDRAVLPLGTLLLPHRLPTHSGANLNNVEL